MLFSSPSFLPSSLCRHSRHHNLSASLGFLRSTIRPLSFSSPLSSQQDLRQQDANSKLRMIILGAPGSGKGTHCAKLIDRYGLAMIGIGDLLRQNVDNQTKLGKLAEGYISKGALLPDSVILELVKPEIMKLKDRHWILDGFPRTRVQAVHLDEFLAAELGEELNLVVSLQVPDQIILKRITDRWIHAPTGRVYNTTYNPPLVAGKDDLTGESLIKRKDDTVEIFGERLKSFHKENERLLEYYTDQFVESDDGAGGRRKRKKLVHKFGECSNLIWPQIQELLQQRFPHLAAKSGSINSP